MVVCQMLVLKFVLSFDFKVNDFWVINTNRTLEGFCSHDLINKVQGALRESDFLNSFLRIHVWIYKLKRIQICVTDCGRYNCYVGFTGGAWFRFIKSWTSDSRDLGVGHRLLHYFLLFECLEVVFGCNFCLLGCLGSLAWLVLIHHYQSVWNLR